MPTVAGRFESPHAVRPKRPIALAVAVAKARRGYIPPRKGNEMRDLQKLEKLSSTAALGLWADDVVIALDRAGTGSALDAGGRELLEAAATTLEEIRDEVGRPMVLPKSTRSLATTDTTLTAVVALAGERESDVRQLLGEMAEVIRRVVRGELADADSESLKVAMNAFSLIGEHQLAESNAVLMPRKDTDAWTVTPMISRCS